MDRGYLRPHSPQRRSGGHPARASTGLLDLHPSNYDSYHGSPRHSRDSLPGPRSSNDRFDRPAPPPRPHHRDSLPLRRSPADYDVAPRRPDPRRPLVVPPTDASYRPAIHTAVEAPPDFRRMRPREGEQLYLQPAPGRTQHQRTLSSTGYGNRQYPAVRRVDSDRTGREQPQGYYHPPAIRARRDTDDHDFGYEYTDFKEQAYRDLAPRPKHRRDSDAGARERPQSISNMEELGRRAAGSRAEGPPVTTRGFGRLDRNDSLRQYRYPRDAGSDEAESASRHRSARDSAGRGDVAVHQDRPDGYSSTTDERPHKHRHQRGSSAEPRRHSKHDIDDERPRRYYEKLLSPTDDDAQRYRRRGSRDTSRDPRRPENDRKERKDESEAEPKRRDRAEQHEREQRPRDRGVESPEEKPRRPKRDESYDKRADGRYDKHDGHNYLADATKGAAAATVAAGTASAYTKHRHGQEADGEKTREQKDGRRRRRRHQKDGNEESDTSTDEGGSDNEQKERRHRRRSEAERRDASRSKNGKEPEGTRSLVATRDEPVPTSRNIRQGDESRGRRHRAESESGGSANSAEQRRQVRWVSPSKDEEPKPKSILKQPKEKFPEDPAPVREGVAPLKEAGKDGVPANARWTKIDRRLVNPEALEVGNERFEERPDYVIVLRVLNKAEIEAYAAKTEEIRGERHYRESRAQTLALEEREHHSSDEDRAPLAIDDHAYNESEALPGMPGYDRREPVPLAAIASNNMASSAPNLPDSQAQRPGPYQSNSYQRLNPNSSGSASMTSSVASAATWPQPNAPSVAPSSSYRPSPQPQAQPPPPSSVLYPQVPQSGSQHSSPQPQQYPPPPPPPSQQQTQYQQSQYQQSQYQQSQYQQAQYQQGQYQQPFYPPPPPPGSTSPPQRQLYGQPSSPPMRVPGIAPQGQAAE